MSEVAWLCESCGWPLARWVTVGADGTRVLACIDCGRRHARQESVS